MSQRVTATIIRKGNSASTAEGEGAVYSLLDDAGVPRSVTVPIGDGDRVDVSCTGRTRRGFRSGLF